MSAATAPAHILPSAVLPAKNNLPKQSHPDIPIKTVQVHFLGLART